jgi:hypothetical protein
MECRILSVPREVNKIIRTRRAADIFVTGVSLPRVALLDAYALSAHNERPGDGPAGERSACS